MMELVQMMKQKTEAVLGNKTKWLSPPQEKISNSGILETGFNCILQMPTGSGKTWLAEQSIGKTVQNKKGKAKRAVYLTPTKALAEELFFRWKNIFPNVGIFTGDYSYKNNKRPPLSIKQAQVIIMTPERLDLCTRNWMRNWEWIPDVDLLIADEIHLISDRTRGSRLEGTISRFRRLNSFTRIIGLSATMGNRRELAEWLGAIEFESDWRPVPLDWKTVTYRNALDKPALLLKTVNENLNNNGQTLVFVQSRRRSEELSKFLLENKITSKPHHAGLSQEKRTETENSFRNGKASVLIATATLEMGINLPVRQVVLYDLQEFNGSNFVPLLTNTVWQRAGRAGRFGKDTCGEVVLFNFWRDSNNKDYELGNFEPLDSQVSNKKMFAEQIIVEVGSRTARSVNQLERVFNLSLAKRQKKLPKIKGIVSELMEAEMICYDTPDLQGKKSKIRIYSDHKLKVTDFGRVAVRHLLYPSTVLLLKKVLKSPALSLTFFDLLLVVSSAKDDFEPQLFVDFEELDFLSEKLSEEISDILLLQDGEQEEASNVFELLGLNGKELLSAIKSALVLRDWTRTGSVETSAENFSCYPFEVNRLISSAQRILIAATQLNEIINLSAKDIVEDDENLSSYVGFIEEFAHPQIQGEKLKALIVMLAGGLNEDAATLTLIKGIGAKTARKLTRIGIEDIEDLAISETKTLLKEKGISKERAKVWIKEARKLQKTHSAFYFRENTSLKMPDTFSNKNKESWGEVDPYRLRRALDLKITGADGKFFRVSGGSEPHIVIFKSNEFICDCMDFQKGNLCKHVLSVRLRKRDKKIVNLADKLKVTKEKDPLDLLSLWLGE